MRLLCCLILALIYCVEATAQLDEGGRLNTEKELSFFKKPTQIQQDSTTTFLQDEMETIVPLYVDYDPVYETKRDYYILDKITYFKQHTVLSFRFVCDNDRFRGATFSAPKGPYPWFLRGNDGSIWPLLKLDNIQRDDTKISVRKSQYNYTVETTDNSSYTVFSCDIHFKNLPENISSVDLIEGEGMESWDYFNFFNIQIKNPENAQLGDVVQQRHNIYNLERRYGIERNNPEDYYGRDPSYDLIFETKGELRDVYVNSGIEKADAAAFGDSIQIGSAYTSAAIAGSGAIQDTLCGQTWYVLPDVVDNWTVLPSDTIYKHKDNQLQAPFDLDALQDFMTKNPKTYLVVKDIPLHLKKSASKDTQNSSATNLQQWFNDNGLRAYAVTPYIQKDQQKEREKTTKNRAKKAAEKQPIEVQMVCPISSE